MSRNLSSLVILAICIFSHDAFATDKGANQAPHNAKSFESRMLTITDVVLEQHIDPPTRQQMILAGVKALYQTDKRPIPKGLSQRISDLTKPGEFTDFLKGILSEFSELKNRESILIRGMLSSLPCGAHIVNAEANKVQGQLAANRYVGIGIALTMNKQEKYPAIPNVIYNGPAWRAGVKPNDLILKVNGQSMKSKDLVQAVKSLRGEEGSDVRIEVRQPGSQESRKLKMTRGRVFIPTVEGSRKKSEGEWYYKFSSADDIA
ncbi:MAG: PDZ domain-containing protein, partial [Gimesia sp.]|nr:PDZ domain-containing protein [Gimesia sp.]